ncbi:MAG: ATP-sensitive inward rectifier potassium channel 10 [Chthoniobacterales bacterium]|nr:ATP-sensitive inward rectifier potassium channel 10 [Chthoniobacterales bacterium]
MKKRSNAVSVHAGQFEFVKINAGKQEWRDIYHWVLALNWPRFVAFISGVYLLINLVFAALYSMGGNCIDGLPAGSLLAAFFFSVETLATVGYGHMFPATVYGHILVTIEIMVGMFWLAVITGLIFVRFSRPTARIEFSKTMVIAPFNGRPSLMLRVANLRHHSMVEAEFRIMFMRDEAILEDDRFRHFYMLKLEFDRLINFPTALTLRHIIDEKSPLHGETAESLRASQARLAASVVCIETVIPATVQSQRDYTWRDIHFGERFVDIYRQTDDGRLTVDYGRLHETEPVAT